MKNKGLCSIALFVLVSILSLLPVRAATNNEDSPKAGTATTVDNQTSNATAFQLTSSAFRQGQPIPRKYTCDGKDISPPLEWKNAPPATKSFALICDDPDAPGGTWVHWVIYNIPGDATDLGENIAAGTRPNGGSNQGVNSWDKINYGGPCPPSGTHRYFFKLYALDSKLGLMGKVDKERLLKEMEGHILAQAELMGRNSKK